MKDLLLSPEEKLPILMLYISAPEPISNQVMVYIDALLEAQHLKTLNGILDEIDGMVDMWQGNPFKLVNGEYQERSFEDYLRQKLQVKPVKSKEYRIGSKNDLSL